MTVLVLEIVLLKLESQNSANFGITIHSMRTILNTDLKISLYVVDIVTSNIIANRIKLKYSHRPAVSVSHLETPEELKRTRVLSSSTTRVW